MTNSSVSSAVYTFTGGIPTCAPIADVTTYTSRCALGAFLFSNFAAADIDGNGGGPLSITGAGASSQTNVSLSFNPHLGSTGIQGMGVTYSVTPLQSGTAPGSAGLSLTGTGNNSFVQTRMCATPVDLYSAICSSPSLVDAVAFLGSSPVSGSFTAPPTLYVRYGMLSRPGDTLATVTQTFSIP